MKELRTEFLLMSRDIMTLISTIKTADVYSAEISAFEVRLTSIESRLVDLSEVTECNESALREAKDALGNQVLVRNEVRLAHT